MTYLFDNTQITILQPTKQKQATTAAAIETGSSNFAIPAAAWQRGIGLGHRARLKDSVKMKAAIIQHLYTTIGPKWCIMQSR